MKEKLGIDPVVGWLVCIQGKEIGKDYRIKGQINTIGRSEKMDICIKDDKTISNENHARLSFSERNNTFNLIPAENKNVIYLNDNEVFTPTLLNAYDVIDFGETKLMFIPFCSDKFDWKSNKQEI
jgi:pSer/pThr/pTyr-binding forkhead associated (FHA) protein